MKVSKAMAKMISTARPDDTVARAAALEGLAATSPRHARVVDPHGC